MTSFLKKFQLLKKKSLESNETNSENKRDQAGSEHRRDQASSEHRRDQANSEHRRDQANSEHRRDQANSEHRRDHWEGHNFAHQPSTSQDAASRRTSQLLPLLIKSVPASSEAYKKPVPLVLPELVQRQHKPSPATGKPAEAVKETTTLPKLPAKATSKSNGTTGKKKLSGTLEETAAAAELSDENFRYIWDSKVLPRGRSLREAVEMLDEREVLDTILGHLQPKPASEEPKPSGRRNSGLPTEVDAGQKRVPITSSKEKISLYRYYGSKLRDTRHKEVVAEYLHMLLGCSSEDETDRVGVAEAIGLAAFCHLREILVALRDYGNMMNARRSLHLEKTLEKSLSSVQVRTTLIQCYGQAAVGAKPEDMIAQSKVIVSEILYQFRGNHKDETLKKTFMKSVAMISKALQDSHKEDVVFPQKSELVICIIDVIEEEPLGSVCFTILHQAMTTVCCMTVLKPALDCDVKSDLVRKSVKKVFSLPALKMTKLKAGSPTHPTQTQDFYLQTINACNAMLTSLLSETPNMEGLQEIMIHTNNWIESERTYERERAVKSTTQMLKFVSEHLDFDVSQEFALLGQLVALLALRTVDTVKEIGLQAAEAMYHLHYITMSKMVKEMEKKHKNKKGNVVKWCREDFFIPGPSIFYNNISKVAKAFGEHLTSSQITDLVLKVIDNLMHEDKTISQAAAVLLSSFLEECGMDVEDLPMIIKEICSRLPTIRDPATKEETMNAICNLASKRLNGVVDCLLESSVECDKNVMELWRALVTDPYANVKLVRPLLKRLQDEDPLSESCNRRNSKSLMPLADLMVIKQVEYVLPVLALLPSHLLKMPATDAGETSGENTTGTQPDNPENSQHPSDSRRESFDNTSFKMSSLFTEPWIKKATNALCWILSLPEACEVVQSKFPHLLIALVTQIYYALGSSRRGSKKSTSSECSELPSPLSSAVQALKNLITCVGYTREYNILGMQSCWEKLQQPDSYFEGVFHLVRTLFAFSKMHLKMAFKQANTYLRHLEIKERTVGMAFFTELLFHGEIGLLFVKQDILDVLQEWMVQPSPLMQIFSIRGLSNLLRHPLEEESLDGLLSPLMSCALDPDRNIAKEAIKTLQDVFRHLNVEEHGSMGITLISHLLKYFSDEDNDLRNDSIGLFGTLLKGAEATEGSRHSVREDIFQSQVPLLIQLADPFTRAVSKDVLTTGNKFMKWGEMPRGLLETNNYASIGDMYCDICKYLLPKYKSRLPEMLLQTLPYMKSKYASYREAAAFLIGNYTPYVTADLVSTKEVEDTFVALRELQGDCEASVSNAAIAAIEHLFRYCGNRIGRHLIPQQLMPLLKSSLRKESLEERK